MGENALYKGQLVKVGTCEEMYYLRFEQRNLVTRAPHSIDVAASVTDLRFRFPWPDEDHVEPGAFSGDYERGIHAPGLVAPKGVEHDLVQFTSNRGYLISLPCPETIPESKLAIRPAFEASMGKVYEIHRNGFGGPVYLVQQRYVPNEGLVPILKCGGCDAKYRVTGDEAVAVATAFEGRAKREAETGDVSRARFYQTIADRVLAGLKVRL